MREYAIAAGADRHRAASWEQVDQQELRQLPQAWQPNQLPSSVPIERWSQLPSYRAALAISTWLGDRCIYRADAPSSGSIAEDLWNFCFAAGSAERMGNCQHFASAATLLLRASGHAARPVVGLRQDWPEGIEDLDRIIRFDARHAHAWKFLVEVWSHNSWYRVDPTLSVSTTVGPRDQARSELERSKTGDSARALDQPALLTWPQMDYISHSISTPSINCRPLQPAFYQTTGHHRLLHIHPPTRNSCSPATHLHGQQSAAKIHPSPRARRAYSRTVCSSQTCWHGSSSQNA